MDLIHFRPLVHFCPDIRLIHLGYLEMMNRLGSNPYSKCNNYYHSLVLRLLGILLHKSTMYLCFSNGLNLTIINRSLQLAFSKYQVTHYLAESCDSVHWHWEFTSVIASASVSLTCCKYERKQSQTQRPTFDVQWESTLKLECWKKYIIWRFLLIWMLSND